MGGGDARDLSARLSSGEDAGGVDGTTPSASLVAMVAIMSCSVARNIVAIRQAGCDEEALCDSGAIDRVRLAAAVVQSAATVNAGQSKVESVTVGSLRRHGRVRWTCQGSVSCGSELILGLEMGRLEGWRAEDEGRLAKGRRRTSLAQRYFPPVLAASTRLLRPTRLC